METEEIKKLIPAALIDQLSAHNLSLITIDGQCILAPQEQVLYINNDQVSGFLARQIMEMKVKLDAIQQSTTVESHS